jgi:anti-sigma factor RsiW
MALFRRRSRRVLVCIQAVALMTDYLDGALSRGERTRLEAHLSDCPHCTEYLRQLRTTIEVLGRVEPETVDPEAMAALVEVYRRWRAD